MNGQQSNWNIHEMEGWLTDDPRGEDWEGWEGENEQALEVAERDRSYLYTEALRGTKNDIPNNMCWEGWEVDCDVTSWEGINKGEFETANNIINRLL